MENLRYAPGVRVARWLIDQGYLGDIQMMARWGIGTQDCNDMHGDANGAYSSVTLTQDYTAHVRLSGGFTTNSLAIANGYLRLRSHLRALTWRDPWLSRLRLGQQEVLRQIGEPLPGEKLIRIQDSRGDLVALADEVAHR